MSFVFFLSPSDDLILLLQASALSRDEKKLIINSLDEPNLPSRGGLDNCYYNQGDVILSETNREEGKERGPAGAMGGRSC